MRRCMKREAPVTVHNVLVGAPDTAAIVNELT